MTEREIRQKVITIAKRWLGYNEKDGSHKKILDVYNSHKPLARGYKVQSKDAWCATYVSAVFIEAGLTDIAPTECSCSQMISLYNAMGRWKEADGYKPNVGDLIMYDWQDNGVGDNKGAPDHVGIVTSVNGSNITVIEGNKNDAVAYRSLSVNGKYIRGYCLPDYAKKESVNPQPVKIDPAHSFDRVYARAYEVTASALNMRIGAGTEKAVIKTLPKGSKVRCYGYYTLVAGTPWLCVVDVAGTTGYCSKRYLF